VAIPTVSLPAFARHTVLPTPKDTNDKTTIFSIYPMEIKEEKITSFPSFFVIPPGTFDKPSRLVVGGSSWWKEIHDSNQLLEIPIYSSAVAKSVVDDYVNSLLAYTPYAHPGLFYIPGDVTVERAKKEYTSAFVEADRKQRAYYKALVDMADVMWSSTSKNPRSISSIMRLAAHELKMETKEWLANEQAVAYTSCPACGSAHNPNFPVCMSCKTIVYPDKYKALGLKAAE